MSSRGPAVTVLSTLALLLAGAWAGGALVTGALVAPVVFHRVPAPTSGDAMTEVFMRFDRAALAMAATLVFTEVALAFLRKPLLRTDVARLLLAIALVGLIVVEASWVSPSIAALHQAGAVRGIGAGGAEIEHLHVVAKRIGMSEVLALVAFIGLHVRRLLQQSTVATPDRRGSQEETLERTRVTEDPAAGA
ncbi:MAG: DUF4149 domain-containing protein [Polyangiaceae bacterium]|nr:DUF4149 domain-containing protein [Polyangiaceae bacterium]